MSHQIDPSEELAEAIANRLFDGEVTANWLLHTTDTDRAITRIHNRLNSYATKTLDGELVLGIYRDVHVDANRERRLAWFAVFAEHGDFLDECVDWSTPNDSMLEAVARAAIQALGDFKLGGDA